MNWPAIRTLVLTILAWILKVCTPKTDEKKSILKKMRENRNEIAAAIGRSDCKRLAELVAIRKGLQDDLDALSAA